MDNEVKKAYEEYKKLPLATGGKHRNAEIYTQQWCIITGRSFVHPHPHRHFTLLEFAFHLGKDEGLFKRFIKTLEE